MGINKVGFSRGEKMPDSIGALIRTIRKRRKMTLERLSELTGISVSSLSRIENTQLGMTIEKIDLLAKALGVAPEDLVSRNQEAVDREPGAQLEVTPASMRLMVDRGRERKASSYRELSFDYLFDRATERSLECMRCTIQSISVWDSEFIRHPGEKIIYVLSGDAVIYCEQKPPLILETSDALFMDAQVWHSTVAVHGPPAELLVTYYHGPKAYQGLFETRTFTPQSWAALQA
jgi:transcriptional regulator with XRE-family HTH domain